MEDKGIVLRPMAYFMSKQSNFLLLIWTSFCCWYILSYRNTFFAPSHEPPSPTVNVIRATTKHRNQNWVSSLTVPHIQVIPYIADNGEATYHPTSNRGNEAMVYLTYLYEFYDNLPDISIFTHGQDEAWHIDGILNYSTVNAINSIDLDEVKRRRYVNLRVSWEWACPNWINTTITTLSPEYDHNLKGEEPFTRKAFQYNFPETSVPEIMSAPCCSQFAVTRETIRALPREQYLRGISWFEASHLESALSGRVWEHMWQWLFLQKAVDCPNEWETLCRTYHVCFESEAEWEAWSTVERDRYNIMQARTAYLANGIQPENESVKILDRQIEALAARLKGGKEEATERGKVAATRRLLVGDF
jgi:hypothetical protein